MEKKNDGDSFSFLKNIVLRNSAQSFVAGVRRTKRLPIVNFY